jgi:hypothetical protein
MYERGRGVAQNPEIAAEWYGCAAEQGDSKAQYRLALLYEKGEGVPQDDNMAYYWLESAAAQDNESAIARLEYYQERTVVDWYRQTTNQGTPPLADDGEHYYDMTYDGATDYYPLGVLHREGWQKLDEYQQSLKSIEYNISPETIAAVEAENKRSPIWIDPIADEDDNDAYYDPILNTRENNGLLYSDVGYRRAIDSFNRAARHAAHSFEQAARQGNSDAQYNLGVMYENGQGIEQDYARAAYWYELAAEQGHARAQYQLGNLYREGLGVKENPAIMEEWWQRAAAQGLQQAARQLDKWKRPRHAHIA